MAIIKKIGSIYFTIILCVFLMVLLIISTSTESLYGTSFAQKIFYQTKWFDLVLSLLWVNILCATLLRFPFKKQHAAFLITHIGILGLLLGALITRLHGIEGRIALYEGETSSRMRQDGYQIMTTFLNQEKVFLDIDKKPQMLSLTKERFNAAVPFCEIKDSKSGKMDTAGRKEKSGEENNLIITANQVVENAEKKFIIREGKGQAAVNRAAKVNVISPKMKLDESFWVVENHPFQPHSDTKFLNALMVKLQIQEEEAAAERPVLQIFNQSDETLAQIDLADSIPDEIKIKKENLLVNGIKYYEFARVVNNQLVDDPSASPNPAVEFDITDSEGKQEHHIKFAFYPTFESIHGKSAQGGLGIKVRLLTPHKKTDMPSRGMSLIINALSSGKWSFVSKQNDKVLNEGEIELKHRYPAGWMDTEFQVEEILTHAAVEPKIVKSSVKDKGAFALEVTLDDGKIQSRQWIMEGQETIFHSLKGDVGIAVVSRTASLPFALTLKDFRKIDYPGTQNPASYESDVALIDQKDKTEIHKTISMNKPLDYKGYRIFQSSYIQDPQFGEASVFSVAKNPGITWIYFSSGIILIGAMFQFYGKKSAKK